MDMLMSWIQETWSGGMAQPWARAMGIFSITLLVAVLVDCLLTRVLLRLVRKTNTAIDDHLVEAVHRPSAISVVLVGSWMAIQSLAPPPAALDLFRGLFLTLAVFMWSGVVFGLGRKVLHFLSLNREQYPLVQPRTLPVFEIALKVLVVGLTLYFLFLAWHIDVSAWLASAGILGVAFGFAAQDTLGNLLSGISILADAPYKLGDYLVLASGERGRVTRIGFRSTRLLTPDEVEVVVPNAVMAGARITNISGGPTELSRIRIPVNVAYGCEPEQVRTTLTTCASAVDGVLIEPARVAPRARFVALGSSSLDFELDVWILRPELQESVVDVLHGRIYQALQAAGIGIPFPQLDVHMVEPEGKSDP